MGTPRKNLRYYVIFAFYRKFQDHNIANSGRRLCAHVTVQASSVVMSFPCASAEESGCQYERFEHYQDDQIRQI